MTKTNGNQAPNKRLLPPDNGVTVRMYRIGHGDCFLLAFAGETKDKPIYVLIDCGYKPGSPNFIKTKPEIKSRTAEVAKNIHEATGGHLHVAVISHEHQDHLNGITKGNFKNIKIDETWLAWTDDPSDEIANRLRKAFKDKLLGLVAARNRLAAEGSLDQSNRIDKFLEFELGWDSEADDMPSAAELLAAAGDPGKSKNKQSMKWFKDRSKTIYIYPDKEEILGIPGARDVRIFALGPPHDPDKIKDLDPQEGESFKLWLNKDPNVALSSGNYFLAAVDSAKLPHNLPFSNQYWIPLDQAASEETAEEYRDFFTNHYGPSDQTESPDNAEWRRIDQEWLYSAEQLAIDINNYTNNSSLVLAFELGEGGKVLLFAADAQRGNWVSWGDYSWKDGNQTVKARDLLDRTVLYKVGHHGSHNATLHGDEKSEHPCLEWMAQKEPYKQEFTAMITAVRAWAETQNGWDHPLKAIKEALLKKSSGRVFQTDTDLEAMEHGMTPEEWKRFKSRTSGDPLYFDYTILR